MIQFALDRNDMVIRKWSKVCIQGGVSDDLYTVTEILSPNFVRLADGQELNTNELIRVSSHTILVVDDDQAIQDYYLRKLKQDTVIPATTNREALQHLTDPNTAIDYVILDYQMSNMDPKLTTEPIAYAIARMDNTFKIIIHTSNSVGAKELQRIINRPCTIIDKTDITHIKDYL